MSVTEKIQAALNDQIGGEFYAAHLYLSMAAYFERLKLPGFARWMRAQYQEETEHALRVFDHLNDLDGDVALGVIEAPPAGFSSPLDAFEKALEHEQRVSKTIYGLYDLAQQELDRPTQVMLQWFITEQVEEEKMVEQIVEDLKRAGTDGTALLILDRQLGSRLPERSQGERGPSLC